MAQYAGNSYNVTYEYKTTIGGAAIRGQPVKLMAGSLGAAVYFASLSVGQATFTPPIPNTAVRVENIVASRVESYENSLAVDTNRITADGKANIWKVSYDVTVANALKKGIILVAAGDVAQATALAAECLGLTTGTVDGNSGGVATIWDEVFAQTTAPQAGQHVTIWSTIRDGAVPGALGVSPSIVVTGVTINPAASAIADQYSLGSWVSSDDAHYKLTATTTPGNATNPTIEWSSSDTTIVEVSQATGYLTPKALGAATITAAALDGSGVSATYPLTTVA